MKLGFLCNSRLGIPSLQTLLHNKIAVSVMIPENITEDTEYIQMLCKQAGVVCTRVKKAGFAEKLDEWLEEEKPDLITVMTFPYIIPAKFLGGLKVIWYNFHFAPLPQYRGAEPIFWLLKNREPKGGISVHQMTDKPDEGPIAIASEITISTNDTHGTHLTKLSYMAPEVLFHLLNAWNQNKGQLPLKQQDSLTGKTYPKANAKDLTIRWDEMNAIDIKALVQAANPWNKGAITFLDGLPLRIGEVMMTNELPGKQTKAGQIMVVDSDFLVCTQDRAALKINLIHSQDGYFTGKRFVELYQPQGKILNHGNF